MDINFLKYIKFILGQGNYDISLTHYSDTLNYTSDVSLPSQLNMMRSGYNNKNIIAHDGVRGRWHKMSLSTSNVNTKPKLNAFGMMYSHYREDNIDQGYLIYSEHGYLLKISDTEYLLSEGTDGVLVQ
jgi:hypothetical protein